MDTQTHVHTYTPLTHTHTHPHSYTPGHTVCPCNPNAPFPWVLSHSSLGWWRLAVWEAHCVPLLEVGFLPGPRVPALFAGWARPLHRLSRCRAPQPQQQSPPRTNEPRNTWPDATLFPFRGDQGSRSMWRPQRQTESLCPQVVCPLSCPHTGRGPPSTPPDPGYEPCTQDLQDVSAEHNGHGTVSFPVDVAVALACLASKDPCPTSCTSQPWPQGAALPVGSWALHTLLAAQTATDTITHRRGALARSLPVLRTPARPVHRQEVGLCLEPQICGGNDNPNSP